MDQMTRSGFFQELARRTSRPRPNLRALFDTDPDRATQFRIEGAGICLDFSKHWIDRATWQWLCDSLDALGFRGSTDRTRLWRPLELHRGPLRVAHGTAWRCTRPLCHRRPAGDVRRTALADSV